MKVFSQINLPNEQFFHHRHPMIYEFEQKEKLREEEVEEMYDQVMIQIKDLYDRLLNPSLSKTSIDETIVESNTAAGADLTENNYDYPTE